MTPKVSSRDETPLEFLRANILAAAQQTHPDVLYDDLLQAEVLNPQDLKILPASLQFKQVAVTGEYSKLPDALMQKIRFRAVDDTGQDLFDTTLPTYELSNRNVSIGYEPDTVEDQEIINSFGGLDNTPPYLIQLRPVLKNEKNRIAVGGDGLPVGEPFSLTMELTSPNGSQSIENTLLTGSLAVIGLVSQQAVIPEVLPDDERDAARLFYEVAIDYIDRWNRAEEELASLLRLHIVRPLPTIVTVGAVFETDRLFDTSFSFDLKGLYGTGFMGRSSDYKLRCESSFDIDLAGHINTRLGNL